MDLSTLVAEIQDELNKGSSVTDAQVRTHVRTALNLLELEHDFQYMHKVLTGTVDKTDAQSGRRIAMPSVIKNIDAVRLTKSDGSYLYLDDVEFEDITANVNEAPSGYYLDGVDYLWMDNNPQENYPYDILYWGHTTWSDADSFEPWLFQVAHGWVKYEALIRLSSFLRQPELRVMWKEDALRFKEAALNANENLVYSNKRMRMGFGHDN